MSIKDGISGVCKVEGCLLDSIYKGKCFSHASPIPCANCNEDDWMHKEIKTTEGEIIRLCSTAIYKIPTDY